jgi:hypothetical protein
MPSVCIAPRHQTVEVFLGGDEGEIEWGRLAKFIVVALVDAFLPQPYKTEYNAIHALHTDEPQPYIDAAGEAVQSIREAYAVEVELGLKSREEADRRLEGHPWYD